jgi:hypothetical protein
VVLCESRRYAFGVGPLPSLDLSGQAESPRKHPFQFAILMIAHELAQGRLVELVKAIA